MIAQGYLSADDWYIFHVFPWFLVILSWPEYMDVFCVCVYARVLMLFMSVCARNTIYLANSLTYGLQILFPQLQV